MPGQHWDTFRWRDTNCTKIPITVDADTTAVDAVAAAVDAVSIMIATVVAADEDATAAAAAVGAKE